eukprot:Gb_24736 [translate_table: standard]
MTLPDAAACVDFDNDNLMPMTHREEYRRKALRQILYDAEVEVSGDKWTCCTLQVSDHRNVFELPAVNTAYGQRVAEMAGQLHCCGGEFWSYIVIIVFLVLFAGSMSGLTLGLMSLSLVDLEVISKSGKPHERKHADVYKQCKLYSSHQEVESNYGAFYQATDGQ